MWCAMSILEKSSCILYLCMSACKLYGAKDKKHDTTIVYIKVYGEMKEITHGCL